MDWFYGEQPQDIYRGFTKVLISQNRIESALEVLVQGKSKSILNLLTDKLDGNENLSNLFHNLSIAQIKRISHQQNSPIIFYSLLYESNHFYWFYKSKFGFEQTYSQATNLLIWVVQPSGKVDFTKVDIKNLYMDNPPDESHKTFSGIVINLLILLADKSKKNHQLIEQILEKLYQILIEPIINFIPKKHDEKLILVPQDFLFLIPFAALKDSQGKYLIEKYDFITVPTIHLLQTAKTKQYKPDLLSMLIVEKDETNEEYNLFQTAKITGKEATKSGVLKSLNDSKILHFAAHCYLYDKENLKYAIALTPECTNNGLLSARDILTYSQYHLREIVTDLVVLSNCDPGYDYIWGNGIMEIILAWLSIGVNNVVSSLWPVPPPVKIFLFTNFYQFLSQNFDVSSAFRQAILITMKTYPHPQYWASFSLIQ